MSTISPPATHQISEPTRPRRPRLLALALLLIPSLAFAHPQDGPHADVEIQILDQAVVFDMLINLVMIDEMGDFPRENSADIHPIEEASIQTGMMAYIAREHRVAIDGVQVAPIVRTFKVIHSDPSNVVLFPRTGMRGLLKIHLVIEYPAKTPPKSVAMRWGTFPPDATLDPDATGIRPPIRLEARLRAEGRLTIARFTRDEPEYIFHATGMTAEDRFAKIPDLTARHSTTQTKTLPGISVGLLAIVMVLFGVATVRGSLRRHAPRLSTISVIAIVGAYLARAAAPIPISTTELPAKQLTEQEALAIFRPLHANIYRAFDYQSESEIYDALARSVAGDMLDSLYNQVFVSLIMQEQGGAVSSVQEVRIIEAKVESIGELETHQQGFAVLARWQVDGVVNHFGHSHWRTNEYLARFGVIESDAGWRISSHQILEQQRLDTDPFTDPTKPTRPIGEL